MLLLKKLPRPDSGITLKEILIRQTSMIPMSLRGSVELSQGAALQTAMSRVKILSPSTQALKVSSGIISLSNISSARPDITVSVSVILAMVVMLSNLTQPPCSNGPSHCSSKLQFCSTGKDGRS